MSQTDKLLTEISEKMDKVLRLLAMETVKGVTAEQGKIELLDSLGFRPIEIAKLLNKSPDNVSVQLNVIRKKREKAAKTQAIEKAGAEKGEKVVSGFVPEQHPEGDKI
jgi:DNA-binding NarL/FixJ family response regulator